MLVEVVLTGTSPLLMHNIQGADPDNPWAKQIATITAKRKKTEADRAEIARLEMMSGLYVDDGRVVVPTANIRKCFQEAAKITKQGRQLSRAVTMHGLVVPLSYAGPQDITQLVDDPNHRDSTLVGVSGRRIVRTRPIFRDWALRTTLEFIPEAMDYDALVNVIELAGRVEGLGDNRVNGHGRFKAEINRE